MHESNKVRLSLVGGRVRWAGRGWEGLRLTDGAAISGRSRPAVMPSTNHRNFSARNSWSPRAGTRSEYRPRDESKTGRFFFFFSFFAGRAPWLVVNARSLVFVQT
ncbi:hypothetical protein EVAR_88532_1 [Eumeta japonica]|uniref:Uncharacterized protein n=1 Tax=Eumeta variegata TaxID=151549 RepID=A0A4C1WNZ4_EUMVA|nr:hypothetical protein EVAR_88532_1 [Eumeta japonica]